MTQRLAVFFGCFVLATEHDFVSEEGFMFQSKLLIIFLNEESRQAPVKRKF